MQVQFIPNKGNTIHIACDLGLRTVISRDLFEDELPMKVDHFIKEVSSERPSHEKERALKDFLITLGKTFQEACNRYRKSNDNIR